MKRRFQCTLTDLSEPMLALSRELNPDCEHFRGDMRSLRLRRTLDVVLVHDAVCYMTTEEDLLAAARTAFEHTAPGGAAIFAPDAGRDSFREEAELLEEQDGPRALRCLMWTWDPDPADSTYAVDFAFLLREGDRMRAVHDHHVEGLFSTDEWCRILSIAGYQVELVTRTIDHAADQIFLCRRAYL